MKQILLFFFMLGVITVEGQMRDLHQYDMLMHSDSAFGVGDSLKLKSWASFKKLQYLFVKDYSKASAYRGINGDTTAYLINIDFTKLKEWMADLHGMVLMFDDGTWLDGKDVHLKSNNINDPDALAIK